MKTKYVIPIIYCILLHGIVFGSVMTVEVTGIVTHIYENDGFVLDGSVNLGTTMTGIFVYDTDTIHDDVLPLYSFPIESIYMKVGNYSFCHNDNGNKLPYFRVGSEDQIYIVNSLSAYFDGSIYDEGVNKCFNDIDWEWTEITTMKIGTSDSSNYSFGKLPDSFPDVSVFDGPNEFSIKFYEPLDWNTSEQGSFLIYGELTSIQVIPEPATIVLLGLGALAMVRRKK